MSDQLNLRQLRYFIAVAEELNFRRAAERLFVTQPPLSRQIKLLEETIGAKLFERNRQGVQLTDAGNAFLADAQSLVQESENVLVRFKPQNKNATTTVNLGITTVIDPSLFTWIEPAFKQLFPNSRLNVKRQISSQSIRDLNKGRLDIAIIGLPSHAEGLTIEHLCDDPMVVCMASNHPVAKKRRVSILELQSDKLFWFTRKLNPAYHDHCEKVFKRLGFRPERIPEPVDHHVLLGLIAAGQGVALVPRSLRSTSRRGVVYKGIEEGEQLRISVGVTYRVSESSATVLSLVGLLKTQFA